MSGQPFGRVPGRVGQASAPSATASPSLLAERGSEPIAISTASERPSPSWSVVARVADAVGVEVGLVGVGRREAVVGEVTHAVAVAVGLQDREPADLGGAIADRPEEGRGGAGAQVEPVEAGDRGRVVGEGGEGNPRWD